MEITKYQQPAPSVDSLARVAKSFALSNYFDDLKGNPDQQIAQAFTKIITGQEFGIPASAAIRGIHIIKGKPAISAGLMSGLIKRSDKYDYRVVEQSEKQCVIDCFEFYNSKREKVGTVTWTMQMAQKAGLINNPTWKKFPHRMLFARAISEACTLYFPDLLLGNVYTPEELDEQYQEPEEAVDAEVIVETTDEATGEVTEHVIQQEAQVEQKSELTPDQMVSMVRNLLDESYQKGGEDLKKAITTANKKLSKFPTDKRGEVQEMIKGYSQRLAEFQVG